jgi:hypothetical protein
LRFYRFEFATQLSGFGQAHDEADTQPDQQGDHTHNGCLHRVSPEIFTFEDFRV